MAHTGDSSKNRLDYTVVQMLLQMYPFELSCTALPRPMRCSLAEAEADAFSFLPYVAGEVG